MPARISLDYETISELDLTDVGAYLYASHPSTKVVLVTYGFDEDELKQWDINDGTPMPQELLDALADDAIIKWAYNAAFERLITWLTLGIRGKYSAWRCTMVLAYSQSFMGKMEMVSEQIGLPLSKQKTKDGTRLIRMFCAPQKPTKKNPWLWRDAFTDPEDWELFRQYNMQDVVTEKAIYHRLIKYEMLPSEWGLYHLDQLINDRGIPIDRQFVTNAITMADHRKAQLLAEMVELTGLPNPASPTQMGDWVRERGYPYDDMRKETIEKVLRENEEGSQVWDHKKREFRTEGPFLATEAVQALEMRQNHARTSVQKYPAMLQRIGADNLFRHAFQFAGASRTSRWAGRGVQVHNLTRTPKYLEPEEEYEYRLEDVTSIIRDGDYDMLCLYVEEPLDALAGTVRSAIAPLDPDEHFVVCDLASIENVSLGYLTGCQRILNIFKEGRDPYKDFATSFYGVPYAEVTKKQRTNSKPAVLGAGYRLGGGELYNGKKSGLWGYAENMKVFLTKEESHESVKVWREQHPEVVQYWYAIERAVEKTVISGSSHSVGPVTFEWHKPYLVCRLPSGRCMYYYKPEITYETKVSRAGNEYQKASITYMGKDQVTNQWQRIESHGGKFTENIVQAFARDILATGLRRAHKAGFNIVLHVHDEIVALQRKFDNFFTKERLRDLMIAPISWAPDVPFGASADYMTFYRK